MAVEDMWGSIAHNIMLGQQKIVPAQDSAKIVSTLLNLQNEYVAGKWVLGTKQDDVHMDVESHVIERLGIDIGGRMHTCRSRNDQVVLGSKLMTRRNINVLREKLAKAVDAFLIRSKDHMHDVMVAYTHVQHAQPVSVAYWLSHYAAILLRDMDRLKRAYDCTDQNPLGSGAIAGNSLPINRELTTKLMGFQTIHEHGLDATSARDFMLDTCHAVTALQTTWSRLAEELILWSSYEFRSVTLDDGFAMGSSMMPQKKNPGPLELLRGRSGRIHGLHMAALTMMKGLPSGYNRDFHEDKEILVEIMALITGATDIVPPLIETTRLNLPRLAELPDFSFATATQLANFLVSEHQVAFRAAHHVVGSLVGELSRAGKDFRDRDYCMAHMKKNNIKCTMAELNAVLDPKLVMEQYNSLGGTGPKAVAAMLDKFNAQLAKQVAELKADQARLSKAYDQTRAIAANIGGIKTAEDIKALVAKHAL